MVALVQPEVRRGELAARVVRPDGMTHLIEFEGLSAESCWIELDRAYAAFGSERFGSVDRLDLWTSAIERLLRFVERTLTGSLRLALEGVERVAWVAGVEPLDRLPVGFNLADTATVFRVPSLDWLTVALPGRAGSVWLAAEPFVDPELSHGRLEADLVGHIAPRETDAVEGYHVIRHGLDAKRLYDELAHRDAHVVLSGCSTAIGLPSVRPGSSRCVSLWPVDTTLAPAFMAAYYARLAEGVNAADALRGAQLAHAGACPIVAAAFVHDGDPT